MVADGTPVPANSAVSDARYEERPPDHFRVTSVDHLENGAMAARPTITAGMRQSLAELLPESSGQEDGESRKRW
jgi:hypothetical protein